ncbi:DUF5946 family protein [Intrasporangium sp.]|uniref:DUF5946 family protein n=1 Tax=Intrasporangium sp. TaxID=1925024 RepID=UPI00293A5620|nr:DUF5946 family protein [Intrasporangium sp.]MDV3220354.1 DUF5946 family protein [Intrasporangium sp.]
MTCECGQPRPCIDSWHEALAEEQQDRTMYRWHLPLVMTFVLQHRSQFRARQASAQYQLLQLYVDRGLEAVLRVAAHQVARNGRAKSGYDLRPLEPYAALPADVWPSAFGLSVHDLRAGDGGFVSDGYEAYGERMRRLSEATVAAWAVATPL